MPKIWRIDGMIWTQSPKLKAQNHNSNLKNRNAAVRYPHFHCRSASANGLNGAVYPFNPMHPGYPCSIRIISYSWLVVFFGYNRSAESGFGMFFFRSFAHPQKGAVIENRGRLLWIGKLEWDWMVSLLELLLFLLYLRIPVRHIFCWSGKPYELRKKKQVLRLP